MSFDRDGFVTVPKFLDEALANRLRSHLLTDRPEWQSVAFPCKGKRGELSVNEIGSDHALEAKEFANRAFIAGKFAYTCLKAKGHDNCGSCPECEARMVMRNNETAELINNLTGVAVGKLNKDFFCEYQPGDYISPHTDRVNGRIGFTLQLSQNWEPRNGGLLHFLDGPKGDVVKVCVPTFNSLTLFDTTKRGIWHMVSHVAPGAPRRLSLSGWYSDAT